MSAHEAPQINPSTPPQTPRVTLQTHSTAIKNTSVNNTQSSSSPENREDFLGKNFREQHHSAFYKILSCSHNQRRSP